MKTLRTPQSNTVCCPRDRLVSARAGTILVPVLHLGKVRETRYQNASRCCHERDGSEHSVAINNKESIWRRTGEKIQVPVLQSSFLEK
jgi:hypothetical protein